MHLKSIVSSSVVVAALLVWNSSAEAQTYYVRMGAGGSGTDWNNALSALPAALARGATYYVADGSYGSYAFADQPGTTLITVKKATPGDHGTDTGWQNSFGDGSANFDSWNIQTNHLLIDGQVGQWASDIPGYVPYGFRVVRNGGNLARQIQLGTASTPKTNITLRHVEAAFTNTPRTGTWAQSMDIFYIFASNVTLSHVWGYDGGRVIILLSGGHDNLTVEYSVLERSGQAQVAMSFSPAEHSEILAAHSGSDNITIRHSYVRDWRSTGGLVLFDQNKNFRFYGNVVTTGYFVSGSEGTDQDGVITSLGAGSGSEAYIYNNTFADIDYGAAIFGDGGWTIGVVQNNLFVNARRQGRRDLLINSELVTRFTRSHNWYFDSGAQSELSIENGSGDPFVNRAGKDYRVKAPTSPGIVLAAPFNIDMLGVVRGADGIWDRGAFESGGTPRVPPSPPTNLRIIR